MKPTTDDVLKWARETGMIGTGAAGNELERLYREAILDALPRFAVRVYAAGAAAMKERAAKVCESLNEDFDSVFVEGCIESIRALGDDDD